MKKIIMDFVDGLSAKARNTLIGFIITLFLGGVGGGSQLVFAKASHLKKHAANFTRHIASHKKADTKKRINVLEEQMLESREMFKKDLRDATEKQKKRYRKWEIEVEMLWKEMEIGG